MSRNWVSQDAAPAWHDETAQLEHDITTVRRMIRTLADIIATAVRDHRASREDQS